MLKILNFKKEKINPYKFPKKTKRFEYIIENFQ